MITRDSFVAFYPQFAAFTPPVVLTSFLDQANARFTDFQEDEAEAQRLYLAHKLTLYARSAVPEEETLTHAALSAAGEPRQAITERRVGEVSVKYASGSSAGSAFSSAFADLSETIYGLQLLSLLRLHATTVYVR